MIKSSALSELLKKAVAQGIDTAFICKISGEILCMEGNESNHTIADIVSSMWVEYFQVGSAILKENKLKYLIIENEDSNIIATNIYSYIICLKGKTTCRMGMMKVHLNVLSEFLNKALEPYKELLMPKEE